MQEEKSKVCRGKRREIRAKTQQRGGPSDAQTKKTPRLKVQGATSSP